MSETLDLGSGFSLRYFGWAPDRSIHENARRYFGIPDIEKLGAILTCKHGIEGAIHFDRGEMYKKVFPHSIWWTVESWELLTISPSVDCGECGCHGYIREGKWIDA